MNFNESFIYSRYSIQPDDDDFILISIQKYKYIVIEKIQQKGLLATALNLHSIY